MSNLGRILEGKRAMVVGGGGIGNGGGVSRALAGAGAAVAVVDLNPDKAAGVAEEINASGGRAVGLSADVTSAEDVERVTGEAVDRLGGLDVLATIVGGFTLFSRWQRLDETSDEEWEHIADLNGRYVYRFARAAIRQFLAQGTGGSIVSIGSISGIVSSPLAAAYGVAKAGLGNLARSVGVEYARDDIRMNIVACGAIQTETTGVVGAHDLGFLDSIPMGRLGTPEEVGDTVTFLASPLAAYITGQTLTIDGGITSRFPMRVPNAPAFTAS
ncbi:MAG: SDR family NAD(P)-dependent oxidoreductase [Acidimicrobiia bacterium]